MATSFRTRRQPRWVAAVVGTLMTLAAVAGAVSIAGSDDPSIPGVLVVVAWAFAGGMSVADLLIPVASSPDDA